MTLVEAFVSLRPGDTDCPYPATERVPITAISRDMSHVSRNLSVVVTVLSSSGARSGFEGLIECEEKFPHHGSEGDFVRFALGTERR
jgi:hypothetical protein